jgi:hypothetical protein
MSAKYNLREEQRYAPKDVIKSSCGTLPVDIESFGEFQYKGGATMNVDSYQFGGGSINFITCERVYNGECLRFIITEKSENDLLFSYCLESLAFSGFSHSPNFKDVPEYYENMQKIIDLVILGTECDAEKLNWNFDEK